MKAVFSYPLRDKLVSSYTSVPIFDKDKAAEILHIIGKLPPKEGLRVKVEL